MIPIFVVRYKQAGMEDKCIEAVQEHTPSDLGSVIEYNNAKHNLTLSKVWNQLIDEYCHPGAFDPWCVLLNTDCFVTPGWLEEMVYVMKEAKENLGFLGPMTDNCGSLQKISKWSIPRGHDFSQMHGKYVTGHHLSGFCLLMDVRAWMKAGGFDETAPMYGQESALIEKCWKLGWQTAIALGCFVQHLGGASFKAAEERGELSHDDEKQKGGQWFREYMHNLRG